MGTKLITEKAINLKSCSEHYRNKLSSSTLLLSDNGLITLIMNFLFLGA